MDPANSDEALVKSAWMWTKARISSCQARIALSGCHLASSQHFDLPLAAYNVSGEFAMIKAAAQNGWNRWRQVHDGSAYLHQKGRRGSDYLVPCPGSRAHTPKGFPAFRGRSESSFDLRLVAWEMTRACNLACVHCRAGACPDKDPAELSYEEAGP